MLSELGEPGAWTRVFNEPNLAKFTEPTVVGVDYPNLGIAQARNDDASGDLRITTYAATSSRRGATTTFRVTRLADPRAVRVRCDGVENPRWRVVAEDAIEIDLEIGDHRFEIATRGPAVDDATNGRRERRSTTGAADVRADNESRAYVPTPAPSCGACCSGSTEAK